MLALASLFFAVNAVPALAAGGRIAGQVNDDKGRNLQDICVVANNNGGDEGVARTDSNGRYAIDALSTGSYTVYFYAQGYYCQAPGSLGAANGGNWLTQWYRNKPDSSSADPVSVNADSDTTGIDAQMRRGGGIKGQVKDNKGAPLGGICVSAYSAATNGLSAGPRGTSRATEADGRYFIEGLSSSGSYKVQFITRNQGGDCTGPASGPGDWVTQWYRNKAGFSSADAIGVILGRDTTGIDAQMQPAGGGTPNPGPGNPPPPASTPAPPPTPAPAQNAPVVLVGGLGADNPLVLPTAPQPCLRLAEFQALCLSLTRAGHPVYVVPESKGATGALELDTGGKVDANARKLTSFIDTFVRGPAPLLVGHSMGGLISRSAVSRYGARASGLFTLGTPHTGSFLADLRLGILEAPCPLRDPRCAAVKAAAFAVPVLSRERAAVDDLTSRARDVANDELGPSRVKTWVLAGTACSFPFIRSEYWSPNDGLVGLSSALGQGARLGPVTSYQEPLWHSSGPLACARLPGDGDENLFSADSSVAKVVAAANSLDGSFAAASRRSSPRSLIIRNNGPTDRASSARSTVRVEFPLSTARGRRLRPGERLVAADRGTLIASPAQFALSCGRKRVSAVQLFDAKLFVAEPTLAGCSGARLISSQPLTAMIAGNPARVTATLTARRSYLRITVSARSAIRAAVLRRGRRRVHTKIRRSGAQRLSLKADLPHGAGQPLAVRVLVGHVRYSGLVLAPS